MMPVLGAEEMRALDRRAIEDLGIPGATLMENAGRGAAEAILDALAALGARPGAHVAIVCGKGGNAGDGFVAARHLRRRGLRPSVWLTSAETDIGGDAAVMLAALRRSGVQPVPADRDAGLRRALAGADIVVDALLGTGARGVPAGPVARAIEAIADSGRPTVALDIPSGLPTDGAPPAGPAVRADLTVTFAALKPALVTGPGLDLAGRVVVVPIGVPEAEVGRGVRTFLLEAADIAPHVPRRARHAHKGSYGHLLVLAGSLGKTGAAALAARAAMRGGAGLVTVATAASQQPVVAGLVLEAMTEALPEASPGSVGLAAWEAASQLAARRDALALGPGLGLHEETQALACLLVRDVASPAVVDADAVTALAGRLDVLTVAAGPRCLTPHPGEMARLLGTAVAEVERDRIACARSFALAHRAWLVLKGAGTVIADPSGAVFVNPTGNPGMASGGSGDVLTGIVGALLARGLAPLAAAQAGVYLHGLAGDRAAGRLGQEALVASDVIAALPDAFAALLGPGR